MHFSSPLLPGCLVKRYKRFLADIVLDSGELITAHCANPGALLGGAAAGSRAWVSHAPSPTRKLAYSLQIVETANTFVGINTSLPNLLVKEGILNGNISELGGYDTLKSEVKYGQNSRIDWLLTHSQRPPCYVEVKNVNWKRGDGAQFPDSVTVRGTKHLQELQAMAATGARAVMIYIIQRNDCKYLSFAGDIDPVYAKSAARVLKLGTKNTIESSVKSTLEPQVEALAFACSVSLRTIEISHSVPVII